VAGGIYDFKALPGGRVPRAAPDAAPDTLPTRR
jgi:hypothetical protein